MGYIGNAPYQGLVTGDNVLDGSITAQDLAPGAAVPSQTGNSGKYLTTDGTNASWGALSQVRVTSIDYPGDDTATLPAGGATLTLTGTGFAATPMVFVDGTLAPSVSFVSSTQITFVAPAKSAGTYHLYIVNPDGATAIFVNGISYSGVPTWTTAAGSLGTYGETFSIQLQATSDSAVTYALATGSSLPGGVTLSSGGLISGTINSEQTFSFSVDAIDAENQETPRSFSVTIALADPFFKSNVLLLPGNGTNGAQNNTFLDSSTNAFSITRNGNTTQGTFSPFSQTGWGNYFDGGGDSLSIADNAAWNMGSGDFTAEAWIYPTSFANEAMIMGQWSGDLGGTGLNWALMLSSGSTGYLRLITSSNGSGVLFDLSTSTFALSLNAWQHVAAVRNGNTYTIYVDGVSRATTTNASALFDATNAFTIGSESNTPSQYFTGYISNVRVVKGTAVYTSNFTPSTTALTAISGTSLLTCQSNRFIDNSSNAFAITRNGDVSVQAFSPFNPTAAWSASTNGGSGYFDGSGDYLNTASNAAFAFGSGSFTIEMWVYSGANGTSTRLGGNGAGGSFTTNRWIIATSTAANPNKFTLAAFNTSPIDLLVSTSTFNNSQWMHVAIARSGNAWAMWVNGAREAYVASNSAALDGGSSEVFNLGRSNLSGDADWAGYVSGFKMVKGTAVYDPASTTITVPTAPPTNTTNTSLLLNYTNAGIYDATSKNDLETVGNAQISTTQSKFGGSSMYFDGTGDFANTAPTVDLEFGSGDFTIEGWIYPVVTTRMALYHGSSGSDWSLGIDFQNQKLCVWASSNGTTWNLINADGGGNGIGTITISANAWTHVAFVRSGTTWQTYINGVRDLNLTGISGSIVNRATSAKSIAKWWFSNGSGAPGVWNGYIQDFRITKGLARYTSNFTPPTTAHKLR